MQPPEPKWTDETKAMYADWFVDCYYYEPSDGEHHARRSDVEAFEEWKPVAAALGVEWTQDIDIPDDVEKMIKERYAARGEKTS